MSASLHIGNVSQAGSYWARMAGPLRDWTAGLTGLGLLCVVRTEFLNLDREELIRWMWLSTCSSLHSSSISPTVLSSFSSHITVVAGEPRDNQLALALWTFCEGSRMHEVGCIFHLGDSTYICINLVLIRTYIRSMQLTFSPLYSLCLSLL